MFDKKAWSKKYKKTDKYKTYQREYRKRPHVLEKTKTYNKRLEVKERKHNWYKEWYARLETQERLKEYRQRIEVKKAKNEWQRENRKRPEIIKRNSEYHKKKWIEYYARPEVKKKKLEINKIPQIIIKNKIRYLTRKKYPIINQKFEFCLAPAVEHHHFTNPYEVDKFNYICHSCNVRQDYSMKLKGGEILV